MQVAGYAVTVLQNGQPLLVGAGVGELEREGGLRGEAVSEVEIGLVERRARRLPTDHDDPAGPHSPISGRAITGPTESSPQAKAHGVLLARVEQNACALLHRLPVEGRAAG